MPKCLLSRVLDFFFLSPPEIWSLTPLRSQTALTTTPLDLSCLLPVSLLQPALTQHSAGLLLDAQFSDLVLDRWFWPTYNLAKPKAEGDGGRCQALQVQPILRWRPSLSLVSPPTNQKESFLDGTSRAWKLPSYRTDSLSSSPRLKCPAGLPKVLGEASFVT